MENAGCKGMDVYQAFTPGGGVVWWCANAGIMENAQCKRFIYRAFLLSHNMGLVCGVVGRGLRGCFYRVFRLCKGCVVGVWCAMVNAMG